MSYVINIKKSAQRSLAKISQPHQTNIIATIRNLSDQPRPPGCKKLSARDAWRIRVGNYRIIYEIKDRELVILIILIGHRSEVYKTKSWYVLTCNKLFQKGFFWNSCCLKNSDFMFQWFCAASWNMMSNNNLQPTRCCGACFKLSGFGKAPSDLKVLGRLPAVGWVRRWTN